MKQKLVNIFTQALKNTRNIYHNFVQDKGYALSASLSYITFLGFIPLVMFLLLFAPNLSFLEMKTVIQDFIFKTFVPESASILQKYLNDVLQRRTGLNVFSFVMLLITSFVLFKTIRVTFDNILKIEERKERSFIRDFEKFVGTLFGGFLFITTLVLLSSLPIIGRIFKLGIINTILVKFLPFLAIFFLFWLMYKFIPFIPLRTSNAFISAFIISIVWVIIKLGFDWYIMNFTNVKSVYGVLGAFPIFMLWLYFNWVIILFGVEILSVLEGRVEINKTDQTNRKENRVSVRITLQKEINGELSKELQTINISNIHLDDKDFEMAIKQMFHIDSGVQVIKDKEKDEQNYDEKS